MGLLDGLFGGGWGGGGGKAIKPKLPSPELMRQYINPIGTNANPGYPTTGGSPSMFGDALGYSGQTLQPMGYNSGISPQALSAGENLLSSALGAYHGSAGASTGGTFDLSNIGGPSSISDNSGGGPDWNKLAMQAAMLAFAL